MCDMQPYLETLPFPPLLPTPSILLLLYSFWAIILPLPSPPSPPSPHSLLSSFQAPPEEDEDGEDLSDMEEGDADASAAKQMSRRQQVYCLAGGVFDFSKLQRMMILS